METYCTVIILGFDVVYTYLLILEYFKFSQKSQQVTAGSLQRMIQNLGIALYSSVSSITIQIFKNHHNMIHGYIVLWIMASIILFIGFILSVKNLLGYKN